MSLTYLNAAMIEQPTVLPYLSANNFEASNITVDSLLKSVNVFGDLTVLGSLSALSGIDFIGTVVATTSSLSVVNAGQGPALYIEQGPSTNGVATFVGDGIELVKINNINPAQGLATLAIRKPTTGPAISAQGTNILEAVDTSYLVATVATISTLNIGALSSISINDATINQALVNDLEVTTASATNINFPETGGFVFNNASVFGSLTVFGSISALSGLNVITTTTTETSSLSIVNTGIGPALYVEQIASPNGVAIFAGDNGTEVLKIRNTQPGNDPGITVTGTITATGSIHSQNGSSNIWNNTTTTVQSNSATTWNYQGTDLKTLSSNWQDTFNTVQNISGIYTTVQNNSATTWNYQGTDLKTLSSNWETTHTTVSNNSANWEIGYNLGTQYSSTSSSFMRRYVTDIGNDALTAFTVTHNLGTRDVITSVYDNSTYENIITSIANTTTNTVSLSFNNVPATNAYRVVVIG